MLSIGRRSTCLVRSGQNQQSIGRLQISGRHVVVLPVDFFCMDAGRGCRSVPQVRQGLQHLHVEVHDEDHDTSIRSVYAKQTHAYVIVILYQFIQSSVHYTFMALYPVVCKCQ